MISERLVSLPFLVTLSGLDDCLDILNLLKSSTSQKCSVHCGSK